MKTRKNEFYYWVIVAAILMEQAVYGGVINNDASLFLIPVTQSLQISRSVFSLAMSTKFVVTFFGTMVSGVVIRKFGSRRFMSYGMLVAGIGCCLLAGSGSVGMLAVGAAVAGMSGVVCNASTVSRVTGAWFHRYHGVILGVVSAATGLGGSLFSVIFTDIMERSHWRMAYLFGGGAYIAAAVVLYLLIRNRPQDMGLKPYGEGYIQKKKSGREEDRWEGFTMEQLKKKPAFYLVLFGTFLACLCPYMTYSVVPAYIQDCGMSTDTVAVTQSLLLLGLAAAKLLVGYFSDKIGPKFATLWCLSMCCVALILLVFLSTPAMAYFAGIILSLSLPLTTIVSALLLPNLFGYRASVSVLCIAQALLPLGNVAGSTLANVLFDRIGSYRPIFLVTACVVVGVIALYVAIFRMTNADKRNWKQSCLEETASQQQI